jgi:hypothetical protein
MLSEVALRRSDMRPMSSALPIAIAQASWIIIRACGAIVTASAPIAITVPIEAARPGMKAWTLAG